MMIQAFTIGVSIVFCDAEAKIWKDKLSADISVACSGACEGFAGDSLIEVVFDQFVKDLYNELSFDQKSMKTDLKAWKARNVQAGLNQKTRNYPLLKEKQDFQHLIKDDITKSVSKGDKAISKISPACWSLIGTQYASFLYNVMPFLESLVPQRRRQKCEAVSAEIEVSVRNALNIMGSIPALQAKVINNVQLDIDADYNSAEIFSLILVICFEVSVVFNAQLSAKMFADQVTKVINDENLLRLSVRYRSNPLQAADSVIEWIHDLSYKSGSPTLATASVLTALLSTEGFEVSMCMAQKLVTKLLLVLIGFGTNAWEALKAQEARKAWKALTKVGRQVFSRFWILSRLVQDLNLELFADVDNMEMSMDVA